MQLILTALSEPCRDGDILYIPLNRISVPLPTLCLTFTWDHNIDLTTDTIIIQVMLFNKPLQILIQVQLMICVMTCPLLLLLLWLTSCPAYAKDMCPAVIIIQYRCTYIILHIMQLVIFVLMPSVLHPFVWNLCTFSKVQLVNSVVIIIVSKNH